jgi:hypothetical protein
MQFDCVFYCLILWLVLCICVGCIGILSCLCMTVCGWLVAWLCCCWAQLGSTGRCFRFAFSYSDCVRQVPVWISSFPNLSISRKFVFVSDLSKFDFVFVSNVKVKTILGLSRLCSTAFNPTPNFRNKWSEIVAARRYQRTSFTHPSPRRSKILEH